MNLRQNLLLLCATLGLALAATGCTLRYMEEPTPAGNPLPPPAAPAQPPAAGK